MKLLTTPTNQDTWIENLTPSPFFRVVNIYLIHKCNRGIVVLSTCESIPVGKHIQTELVVFVDSPFYRTLGTKNIGAVNE